MEPTMLPEEQILRLEKLALQARQQRARVPISGYSVGAALLAEDGRVFTAGNIECYGQTPSICAERVALFKALSEGCDRFAALAVCGGPMGEPLQKICTPCGTCRQVLTQFCPADLPVICTKGPGIHTIYRLRELLPFGWSRD